MKYLFDANKPLDCRVFNICCLSIIILSFNNIIINFALSIGNMTLFMDILIILFVFCMLYFSNSNENSKNYSYLTCVVLNFILLPILFFINNKTESGMYFYFIIGLVFSAATLKKEERNFIIICEIIMQFFLMLIKHVIFRIPIGTIGASSFYFSVINAFITTSISLGVIIITILKGFEDKNSELSQINEYLKEIAEIDALTGLWNRKYMEQALKDHIKNAIANKSNLSIIMLDIDHFKSINDIYGHQMGDKILKKIGRTIKKTIRNHDIATRYGGEEFLVILPNTDSTSAYKLAEKIRIVISKTISVPEDSKNITISGGISSLNENAKSTDLVKIADENLYMAKESGRNKIVM